MKKTALLLLALALAPVLGWAATPTNTPTPNATQTAAQTQIQQTQTAIAATATYIQTAFPTLTPTLTPTGTLTPSPTFTPAPKQLKSDQRERYVIYPVDFTSATGATLLNGTTTTGGTVPWLAQNLSQTCAVLSTGAAEVRMEWVVPRDFKGNLKLYAYCLNTVVGDGVSLTVSVTGQHFNMTTQSAGTYSYTPPPGGFYQISGVSTQILAGTYADADPLWDTPVQVVSRVHLPTAASLSAYATANPPGYVQYGDLLNIDILKAAGNAGLLYVYDVECQYDYYVGIPQ
jgi:hypothetical protein